MTQLVYCIKHDYYAPIITDVDGELCHDDARLFDGDIDHDLCYFPQGFIPQYVLDMSDDWLNGLIEPSEEELERMDECAQELLYELA